MNETNIGGEAAKTATDARNGSAGRLAHTAVRLPPQIQGRGQAEMTCPIDAVESVSAIPELLEPEFGRDPNAVSRILLDEEVATILGVTVDWVRSHAKEIPGFVPLGSYYRFRSLPLERWLGTLDRLLTVEETAKLLKVPPSWVYANADQLAGLLRLGSCLRFRPRILEHAFFRSEEVE